MQDGNLNPIDNQKIDSNITQESISHKYIFFNLMCLILAIEAGIILLGSIKRGLFRKQVLSKKTNLGFNVDIFYRS